MKYSTVWNGETNRQLSQRRPTDGDPYILGSLMKVIDDDDDDDDDVMMITSRSDHWYLTFHSDQFLYHLFTQCTKWTHNNVVIHPQVASPELFHVRLGKRYKMFLCLSITPPKRTVEVEVKFLTFLVSSSCFGHFRPGVKVPDIHCIGGLVGPKAIVGLVA